jgi:hypothetical protein
LFLSWTKWRPSAEEAEAGGAFEETYDLYLSSLLEMREAMEKWEAFAQSSCIDIPACLAA